MRETPLYQGAEYREAERPQANLPRLSLPENPFARALPQAVEAVNDGLYKYARLKAYQEKLNRATERKVLETEFKGELKRRAQLPWGSTDSVYLSDGKINNEAVSSLVAQYQEKMLGTRGNFWLREDNIQDEAAIESENAFLKLDAFEMLGAQEVQNMRTAFDDSLGLALDSDKFNDARVVVSSGVLEGLITPQKAERLKLDIDEREHEFGQEALDARAAQMMNSGDWDELGMAVARGEFDELDSDRMMRLKRNINSNVGGPRRVKVGDNKSALRAPAGLPNYMADVIDVHLAKGESITLEERGARDVAFSQYVLGSIEHANDLEGVERCKKVAKLAGMPGPVATAFINRRIAQMNGTAKFTVPSYGDAFTHGSPLLTDAQIEERRKMEAENAHWSERMKDWSQKKKNSSKGKEVKAKLDANKVRLKLLKDCEAYNQRRVKAVAEAASAQVLARDPRASEVAQLAAANHAVREYFSQVNVNVNPDRSSALREMEDLATQWQLHKRGQEELAREKRAEDSRDLRTYVDEFGRGIVPETNAYMQPKDLRKGAEKVVALYVPKGSPLAGRSIMVQLGGKYEHRQVFRTVEADVDAPVLSAGARANLGDATQDMRYLSISGNVAILADKPYTFDDGTAQAGEEPAEPQEGGEDAEEAEPMSEAGGGNILVAGDEDVPEGERYVAPEGALPFDV